MFELKKIYWEVLVFFEEKFNRFECFIVIFARSCRWVWAWSYFRFYFIFDFFQDLGEREELLFFGMMSPIFVFCIVLCVWYWVEKVLERSPWFGYYYVVLRWFGVYYLIFLELRFVQDICFDYLLWLQRMFFGCNFRL